MVNPEVFPVSKAKIRVPFRRQELVSRPRLTDLLFDQFEQRLLLVYAPAGYGKTSLLIDLATHSEIPVCWLSLDALDQEPQRFLVYLISALAEKFPKFGSDSLAALESMASFEQDGERLMVTLSNEIASKINDHFYLILDDFHLVGDVLLIRQIVSRLLQVVDENVHLILATRNLPDLPDMPLMVARNQVGGLDFEELSFRPEEIQQFFQQNSGRELSPEDAETLVRETEGWIAAIHLTGGRPGRLPQLQPLRSTRELFDFFSQEVLSSQPEDMRRFLLMTSYLDTFDVTLCKEVLDPLLDRVKLDWPVLFLAAQKDNLFSVPLGDDGRWMRYHHLFQHFLKSKLQYEDPALAWHIQQNLARAYERAQTWDEALQVYDSLDDHENLVRVLSEAGQAFIRKGRILTLSSWLDRLPTKLIYSQPALMSLQGAVFGTKGDTHQALDLFDRAETRQRASGDYPGLMLTLVRRAGAKHRLGNYSGALADADQALQVTVEAQNPTIQAAFAEAQRFKGLAFLGLGKFHEALAWLKESLQSWQELGISTNVSILESELGVVYRRLGDTESAARYYASALATWENLANSGWKAHLLNNLALLYHLTGRLEDAYPLLEKALKVAEENGYARLQATVLVGLGDILSDLQDFETARRYYETALTLATNLGNSPLIFYATLGEARLHRLGGEVSRTLDELRRIEATQINLGAYERVLFDLERGCSLLEYGQAAQATELLTEVISLLGPGENQEKAALQLWLAASKCESDPVRAAVELKNVLPPERDWQKPAPIILHAGRVMAWLKRKGFYPFRDQLLDRFFEQAERVYGQLPILGHRLRAGSQQVFIQAPLIEISTFGPLQVKIDGRLVGLPEWQTREARDMFVFMLQARPMTKEQIALEFWPDISSARLKMRFKVNMYRIRHALGQDVVIFDGENYLFNRTLNYRWDREKFDELIGIALNTTDRQKRYNLLSAAMSLVKGVYLEDIELGWVVREKLKYKEIFIRGFLELAEINFAEGRFHACLDAARQVLVFDHLLEAAHRFIIQAHFALRDPAGMARQYHLYQQELGEELGMLPSSEIIALYETLIREV
ncbi:MAG: tetratricopeptide repeat protein [Chloroflexota bacterium]